MTTNVKPWSRSESRDLIHEMLTNEPEQAPVFIDGGSFVIRPKNWGAYYIGLDRIDNPIKLIWWIHHLCEKQWFNQRMSKRLIELATERMGLKMYQGQG
jgi:hypothetical protein